MQELKNVKNTVEKEQERDSNSLRDNFSMLKMNFTEIKNKVWNIKPSTLFFYIALAIVIFAGVFFRAKFFSYNTPFWTDEAWLGMNVLTRSYLQMFSPLHYGQVAPPFFMVISKFLLDISGQSNNIYTRDFILRLLPFVCSVISVPLFAFVLHKVFKHRYITLIGTLILSLNSVAINYALEFKQYGVELLFTIILFFAFYNLDFVKDSAKKIFNYFILFSLSPWFSYSVFFILPAGFICILYDIFKEKYFDKVKIYAAVFPFSLSIILLYFLNIKRVIRRHYDFMYNHWNFIFPSFFTVDNFQEMFLEKIQSLLPFIELRYVLIVLLAPLIIFICKNNRKILVLTLVPILLCILASFMHKYPFEQRLILFLLPLFVIILAQIAHIIKSNRVSNLIVCAVIISITLSQLVYPCIERKFHDVNKQAREFVQVLFSENSDLSRTIVYSNVGIYYVFPYKGGHKPLIESDYEWNPVKTEEIEDSFVVLPKNQVLWLYAPKSRKQIENNIVIATRKYIENNKNYQILDIWEDKEANGYLLKFKKN